MSFYNISRFTLFLTTILLRISNISYTIVLPFYFNLMTLLLRGHPYKFLLFQVLKNLLLRDSRYEFL